MRNTIKTLNPERLGWRTRPGLLGRHASSPQSVHALLGYFLKDRKSPTPFPGRDMLATEGFFDWGLARATREGHRDARAPATCCCRCPRSTASSVAVVEPWGASAPIRSANPSAPPRTSPTSCSRWPTPTRAVPGLAERRSRTRSAWPTCSVPSIATIVQGGNPSVHDAAASTARSAGLDDLLALMDQLLLHRSIGSGPTIFICLGHQLAAASHIRLLQRAVEEVQAARTRCRSIRAAARSRHCSASASESQRSASRCASSSRTRCARTGWHEPGFAVARNENPEFGTRRLMPYTRRNDDRTTCHRNCTRRTHWSPTSSRA